MSAASGQPSAKQPGVGPYWYLRVVETLLLLAALVGMGMFAWSLIDIIRIETAAAQTKEVPPTLWPGIFLFVGSMIVLQIVRAVLGRYRREDGSARGDVRGSVVATTAEALASADEGPTTGTVPDARENA